jgi:osmotically-inducible protein OsmY
MPRTHLRFETQPIPTEPCACQALADRVRKALVVHPHLRRTLVDCEAAQGCVTLKGRVDSFFQKQMAQEALRHLEGVAKIDNQLEVAWPEPEEACCAG